VGGYNALTGNFTAGWNAYAAWYHRNAAALSGCAAPWPPRPPPVPSPPLVAPPAVPGVPVVAPPAVPPADLLLATLQQGEAPVPAAPPAPAPEGFSFNIFGRRRRLASSSTGTQRQQQTSVAPRAQGQGRALHQAAAAGQLRTSKPLLGPAWPDINSLGAGHLRDMAVRGR